MSMIINPHWGIAGQLIDAQYDAGYGGLTLSNSNRTATSPAAPYKSARLNGFLSADKWYWEYVHNTNGTGGGTSGYGICQSGHLSTTMFLGQAAAAGSRSVGLLNDGRSMLNGSTIYGLGSMSPGDIIMVAVDLTALKIWYGRNGAWLNSGNPAAGTNPVWSTFTASDWYPAGYHSNQNGQHTIRVKSPEFSYPPPAGFNAPSR